MRLQLILRYTIILFLLIACSNILDKEPEEYVAYADALETKDDLNAALNGIYGELQSPNYYGRNLLVFGDLLADNTKISPQNSDKFISFYNHTHTASEPEVEGLWQSCYNVINRANAVINAINSKDENQEDAELNQIKAEAYCLRALAYFDLMRVFAFQHTTTGIDGILNENGEIMGVPLIVDDVKSDSLISPKRAKYGAIYGQVTSDLKQSLNLFNSDIYPLRMSKNAAYALLGKMYILWGDYANALKYLFYIVQSEQYSLVPHDEYIESWKREYTEETVFSVAMTSSDYNGTDALGYLYLRKGYNDIIPSQDLISLYKADDIRTQLIDKATEIKKFPGRDDVIGLDNIPVIRYADVLLMFAEAVVKTNYYDVNIAQEAMDLVAQRANPDAIPYTQPKEALFDLLIIERRKELAFEGHRFFDLMRLKRSIVRNDCSASKCEILYPSKTCVLPIPQHEINANENMVQNPGY